MSNEVRWLFRYFNGQLKITPSCAIDQGRQLYNRVPMRSDVEFMEIMMLKEYGEDYTVFGTFTPGDEYGHVDYKVTSAKETC